MKRRFVVPLVAVALLALVGRAQATFHLWMPDEIFSDPSGNVQFVEFSTADDFQNFLTNTSITSTTTGNTYHFPTDLPGNPTGGQHFLVATPGYAALAGVPVADYVLPMNNFFSTSADSVYLIGTAEPPLTYSPGDLPLDGTHALFFDGVTLSSGVASVTNFAGESGAVSVPAPEPASIGLLALGAGLFLRRRSKTLAH